MKRRRKLSRVGFARALAGQRVEQPLHRRFLGGFLDGDARRSFSSRTASSTRIAGDLLDVAADIADLGELGRLDLHERRVGELGEAAG
jgi:hypothetical protein